VPQKFEKLADGRCLIHLEGEVDLAVVPELVAEFEYAMDHVSPALVVDLSAVDFIDSSGLAVLVRMRQVASSREGGGLVLTGETEAVTQLLRLTRLDDFFEISPGTGDGTDPSA
jgi:anti-sigma B factor antagonist